MPRGQAGRRWVARVALVVALSALSLLFLGSSTAARTAAATFPGTNGRLVFSGLDLDSRTVQLYTIAPDGTGLTAVTTPSGGIWNECPSWAANGSTIYFDSVNRAPASRSRIYRMNADGSGRTLADQRNAPSHVCPTVNRAGSRIAAMQFPNRGGSVIVRMNANGSQRKVIARAAARQDNYTPMYAPSGANVLFNRVTYTAHNGFARSDFLVVDGAGRTTNITARTTARFFAPAWTPDGNTILAVRGAAMHQIVSMTSSGGNVHLLATLEGGGTVGDVTYSPDGTKIAFLVCDGDCGDPLVQDEGVGSIWIMNADGSNATAIFTQPPEGGTVQPFGTLDWGIGG